MPRLAPLPLVALALAGCLSAPGPGGGPPAQPPLVVPEEWAALALPAGQGHNHSDPDEHRALSTPNFEVLGWDPLLTEAKGGSAGGYLCGDLATTQEGRRLAVVHSFTTDVAFVVADVTDPARPRKVGEYVLEWAHTYDVAVTPDGKHVVLGTSPLDTGPDQSPAALPAPEGPRVARVQPMFRDACTGELRAQGPERMLPLASGVVLVGIEDPAEPVFEDFRPMPLLGPHSVSTAEVDGRQLVLASVTNLAHGASYFHFLEVEDTPLGPRLAHLGTYQAQQPPSPEGPAAVFNGHVDGTIQEHPLTGQALAYLANWDGGVVVVDITEPRTPRAIGAWSDGPGLGLQGGESLGAIHEALPIEGLWDGRHYTIAGQELGGRPQGRPTGWVYVLDTTDPARVEEVGRWTLPVDVAWDGFLQFSTHYVEVVGRTLFVTMYHGGVWAVDLSTPERLREPATVGVFLPDRVSPKPPKGPAFGWTPTVLDVLAYPNGDLVVFDGPSGLYTLRFDAAKPAPAPPPWRTA